MVDFILILIGIGGLWAATELVVGGSVAIASHHGISEFYVGLIILAIGSDLPELAVAIDSGIRTLQGQDVSGIVTGACIGSSFGQIGGVMGVTGLIGYLVLPKRTIYQHGSILLGSILILGLTGFDGQINRVEGFILLILFLLYLFIILGDRHIQEKNKQTKTNAISLRWLQLGGGMVLIFFASNLAIDSCINLSTLLGINKSVISVIFIGFGTSLPELTISIGAVLKKKSALSVGNLIGSNIFDTLVPIGVAALISPVVFAREFLVFDLPLLFILTFLVFVFFLRKKGLQRKESLVLLFFYGTYIVLKIL
jgi:cation:H+ antiporter